MPRPTRGNRPADSRAFAPDALPALFPFLARWTVRDAKQSRVLGWSVIEIGESDLGMGPIRAGSDCFANDRDAEAFVVRCAMGDRTGDRTTRLCRRALLFLAVNAPSDYERLMSRHAAVHGAWVLPAEDRVRLREVE